MNEELEKAVSVMRQIVKAIAESPNSDACKGNELAEHLDSSLLEVEELARGFLIDYPEKPKGLEDE